MIISISGTPGSGKTSVAKYIAKDLGMKFYSVGELRGKMAKERGMTLDEFNKLGETERFTDEDADEYQKQLGINEDNFVIEGRLCWHFIPNSFKIFLTCDLDEAARRIFEARKNPEEGRDDERMYKSIEDAKKQIEERMASDTKRYQKYYGLNYQDPENYDLVVDTTDQESIESSATYILNDLKQRGVTVGEK
jgi:cytidylate kinase